MFGKCFESGVPRQLKFLSLKEFKQHQLQSCFIVSLDSRFLKPMKSDDFRGELTLNKISWIGGVMFCFTSIAFSDAEALKAQGTGLLALNRQAGGLNH